MIKYIIYKLAFPNGKVYIGQTINFNNRMRKYKSDAYNQSENNKNYNSYISKAIRKYEWNNIKKEILYNVSEEFVDELETKIIAEYNATDRKFGYNLESGGNKNKHLSEESKEKNRQAHLGKSTWNKGISWSKEIKQKIGESVKKVVLGKDKPYLCKPINVYNKFNKEYIQTFKSIKETSKQLNISAGNINDILNNRNNRKSAGGYIFKYKLV